MDLGGGVSTFAERQKARQDRLTPDIIMGIAQRQGYFTVSLRYRDDWLRGRCGKLVKAKKLRRDRRIHKGNFVFYPTYRVSSSE